MQAGDVVRIDFPGHVAHGRRVTVVEIVAEFDLAPEGAGPIWREIIFVQRRGAAEPIGLGRARLRPATVADRQHAGEDDR